MKMRGMIQSALVYMLLLWSTGCSLCFFLSILPEDSDFDFPSALPLPWSDVDDALKASDGDIYVALRFFQRIVRYDRTGDFIRSYPYPSKRASGVTEAATTSDDILYIQLDNIVYACTPDIKLISALNLSQDNSSSAGVKSGSYDRLRFLPMLQAALFFEDDHKWMRHVVPSVEPQQTDTTRLVRRRHGLEIRSAEGALLSRVGTPWFLIPFIAPWPALLAWPLTFIGIFIRGVASLNIHSRNHHDEEGRYSTLQMKTPDRQKRRFLIDSDFQELITPRTRKRGQKQEVLIQEASQGTWHILIPKEEYRKKRALPTAYILVTVMVILLGGFSVFVLPKALEGRYAEDMLLQILFIVGLLGYVWLTIGILGFRFFHDAAGFDTIELNSRENRVSVFEKLHVRLLPGVPLFFEMDTRKRSASLRDTQISMKAAPSFVDGQVHRKLRLMLNRRKITLVPEHSTETKQQLLEYLQETLELMKTYAAIETVIFADGNPLEPECATALWNPDAAELTVAMPALKNVNISTDSYDLHRIEQFLTYAVNHIGRDTLKTQVDVVLNGKAEQLHPNLYNNLQHIFRTVSEA